MEKLLVCNMTTFLLSIIHINMLKIYTAKQLKALKTLRVMKADSKLYLAQMHNVYYTAFLAIHFPQCILTL